MARALKTKPEEVEAAIDGDWWLRFPMTREYIYLEVDTGKLVWIWKKGKK